MLKTGLLLFAVVLALSSESHASCRCTKERGDRKTSIASQPHLLIATVDRLEMKTKSVHFKVNKVLAGKKQTHIQISPLQNEHPCFDSYTFLKPGQKVLIASSDDVIKQSGKMFHLSICDYLIYPGIDDYEWAVEGGLEKAIRAAK